MLLQIGSSTLKRMRAHVACARACMHGGAYRRHKAKALTGRKWLLRWLASDRTRAGEIARPE